MGILTNQYSIAKLDVIDGKVIGTSRLKDIKPMPQWKARNACEAANAESTGATFVVININAE